MTYEREPQIHFPIVCVFCIKKSSFIFLKDETELTEHMFKLHKEDMRKLVTDLDTRIKLDKMLDEFVEAGKKNMYEEAKL